MMYPGAPVPPRPVLPQQGFMARLMQQLSGGARTPASSFAFRAGSPLARAGFQTPTNFAQLRALHQATQSVYGGRGTPAQAPQAQAQAPGWQGYNYYNRPFGKPVWSGANSPNYAELNRAANMTNG